VSLGRNCIVGKGVYIDFGVQIGDRVKIQNGASIYHGATIEDGVFIGPHVCLTNDKLPRAINPDATLKRADDWQVRPVIVRFGAAIGAQSVVLPGVTVGRWAVVGSGAVVTHDVPDYGLVWGNPARLHGYACPCGHRFEAIRQENGVVQARCPQCGEEVSFSRTDWEVAQP
jgi:acetyltransferase-like isoleucine patch superfamily enzyme